jgi:hypothetical protein
MSELMAVRNAFHKYLEIFNLLENLNLDLRKYYLNNFKGSTKIELAKILFTQYLSSS